MKCLECSHMQIISIEDGYGAEAKCYKTSKKGKSIDWAMTTISPHDNWKKEEGRDRVIQSLSLKKAAPFWCQLRKQKEE